MPPPELEYASLSAQSRPSEVDALNDDFECLIIEDEFEKEMTAPERVAKKQTSTESQEESAAPPHSVIGFLQASLTCGIQKNINLDTADWTSERC